MHARKYSAGRRRCDEFSGFKGVRLVPGSNLSCGARISTLLSRFNSQTSPVS
jgi:hypothetical protein